MRIKRVIVIVLDGVGAGEAPDAALYGDVGSNSLANTARAVNGLNMPNLEKLGMGYITDILGVPPDKNAVGGHGKMLPMSAGKDTIAGHWEMMGIYLPEAFPTFPNGFPKEVLDAFREQTGLGVLGNKPASGTEILKELGAEHMRTGTPIVYTSADSVFQVAAHEEIIPIQSLYEICEKSRRLLTGKYNVGRVIARPFLGDGPDTFYRTERRRDFPRLPETDTTLDILVRAGKPVYSVGKIDDIFGHRGITHSNHKSSNHDCINATLEYLREDFEGLLFVNLIEYDMIYGHRNDPSGYASALENFDKRMPEIVEEMGPEDLLIISADHGVDPTTKGTDHSREYVPLLVYNKQRPRNVDLGTRKTFADVGATICEVFGLPKPKYGESFLSDLAR
jgi:phosphopentomutase